MLLLTTFACVLAYSVRVKERCEAQREFIKKHDGVVLYSHQLATPAAEALSPIEIKRIHKNGLKGGAQWPGPPRLRQLLGDDAFTTIAQAYVFGQTDQNATVGDFSGLSTLKLLEINGWSLLTKIEGFEELRQLEALQIKPCYNLTDYGPIAELKQIKRIHLVGCAWMTRPPFGNLKKLEHLSIKGCPLLNDITEFERLQNLETLTITSAYPLEDFSPIKKLNKLKRLDLSRAPGLKDLKFIKGLSELEAVTVTECGNLAEWDTVFDLQQLKELNITRCSHIKKEDAEELQRRLPNTKVRH